MEGSYGPKWPQPRCHCVELLNNNADLSVINEFAVYNRWAQAVYSAKNKTPESAGGGWNETYKGQPAQGGIYVYIINTTISKKSLSRMTSFLLPFGLEPESSD